SDVSTPFTLLSFNLQTLPIITDGPCSHPELSRVFPPHRWVAASSFISQSPLFSREIKAGSGKPCSLASADRRKESSPAARYRLASLFCGKEKGRHGCTALQRPDQGPDAHPGMDGDFPT